MAGNRYTRDRQTDRQIVKSLSFWHRNTYKGTAMSIGHCSVLFVCASDGADRFLREGW